MATAPIAPPLAVIGIIVENPVYEEQNNAYNLDIPQHKKNVIVGSVNINYNGLHVV